MSSIVAGMGEVVPIGLFGEAGSTVREYEMPLAPSLPKGKARIRSVSKVCTCKGHQGAG